jgi:hypothetical protein
MKYSLRSMMTFSIRDLFWLTVVVAMGVAWWLDHRRWEPTELTRSEAEWLQRQNKYLQDGIDNIDRQLADHGFQLEERSFLGLGGRKTIYLDVVPLPNSSAPAPKLPND